MASLVREVFGMTVVLCVMLVKAFEYSLKDAPPVIFLRILILSDIGG